MADRAESKKWRTGSSHEVSGPYGILIGSVELAWQDLQHPSKTALHHYCRHLCPESEGCAAKRWISARPVQEPPRCATQGLNKNAESYIAQLREVWR